MSNNFFRQRTPITSKTISRAKWVKKSLRTTLLFPQTKAQEAPSTAHQLLRLAQSVALQCCARWKTRVLMIFRYFQSWLRASHLQHRAGNILIFLLSKNMAMMPCQPELFSCTWTNCTSFSDKLWKIKRNYTLLVLYKWRTKWRNATS